MHGSQPEHTPDLGKKSALHWEPAWHSGCRAWGLGSPSWQESVATGLIYSTHLPLLKGFGTWQNCCSISFGVYPKPIITAFNKFSWNWKIQISNVRLLGYLYNTTDTCESLSCHSIPREVNQLSLNLINGVYLLSLGTTREQHGEGLPQNNWKEPSFPRPSSSSPAALTFPISGNFLSITQLKQDAGYLMLKFSGIPAAHRDHTSIHV